MPDTPEDPAPDAPAKGTEAPQNPPTEPPKADPGTPAPSDLGDAGKKALEAERTARKTAEKALQDALKAADAGKSAEQRLADQMAELNGKFEAAERARLRLEVASEHNIPRDYHDLLTATDADALRAQAEKVAALVRASATPSHQPVPGQGQQGGAASLDSQIAQAMADGNTVLAISLQNQKLLAPQTAR